MNNTFFKKLFLSSFFAISLTFAFAQPINQKLRADRYETILRAGRTGSADPDNTATSAIIYLYGVPMDRTDVTAAVITFLNNPALVPLHAMMWQVR